jgi:CTP synthase (UTP-ammonia lyase)
VVVQDGFWPMQEPQKMADGNWIMAGFRVANGYGVVGHLPAVAISKGADLTKWDMAVIEAARSLAGVADANSTEFGPTTEPVVGLMTEWMRGNELETRREGGNLGGTMRLGAFRASLKPGSKIARIR